MKKKILKSIACLGASAFLIGALSGCVPFFLAVPLFSKNAKALYTTFLQSDTFARLREDYQLTYSYFTYPYPSAEQKFYNYEYAYSADGEQAAFQDLQDSTVFALFQGNEEKTFSAEDGESAEYVTEKSFADYPYADEVKAVWDFLADDSVPKTADINISYLMVVNGYWGYITLSDFQLTLRDKTYTSGYIAFLTDKKGTYFQEVAVSLSVSDAVYRICPPEKDTPQNYEEQYEEAKSRL
jgi:hypothetical protein